MQQIIQQLLRLQTAIWALSVFMAWCFVGNAVAVAVGCGGAVAIVANFPAKLLFARLPEVMSAKAFYRAMVLSEIMKWLVVCGLAVAFALQQDNGLVLMAFVAGFVVVYSAFFWILLIKNRG